jgi:hypothetical protein
MIKQLLTLTILFLCCASITHASDKNNPVFKSESNKDELAFHVISKLQIYNGGADINCNLRIHNVSGETKFIQEVVIEFLLETEDKKTGNKSEMVQKVSFTKNWIIANKDYAFYSPKNKKLSPPKKSKCTKIIRCSVSKINYGLSSKEKKDNRKVKFNEETTLGLISPVILKIQFKKMMDRGVGYYKKDLADQYTSPTRVECTMKFENTGNSLVKIKDDVLINLNVEDVTISNPIQPMKILPSESITQNVFSIHFSQKLNPSEIEMFLISTKTKLLLK